MRLVLSLSISMAWLLACGSAPPPPQPVTAQPSTRPSALAAAGAGTDAGVAASEPGAAPKQPPFAKTNAEAIALIDEALETHRPGVAACVRSARERSTTPDATIAVDITIDQEGKVIGVNAPKGVKGDPALHACIRSAIAGTQFPRSNTGLITIKRTFERRQSTP